MMEAGTSVVQAGAVPSCATDPRVQLHDFERLEDYLRAYVEDERFRSRYLRAGELWSDASAMLWRADSRDKVIAVSSKAREAMWEFASALVEWHGAHGASRVSSETLDRVSSVIEMYRPQLGDSRCALLEALLSYWQALNSVVQRHRDRAQDVRERLTWEDGRRVVVLTALVMVEVDRCV